MTSLAVKILRDEDGNEFVPYTSTDALYDPDGETIADKIAEKLETSSLIAGTGITLIPDITNHTVEIQSSAPGANLINNVTTPTAGQGALDAYQGYLLNNKIPTKLNQLNDRTTDLLSEPRFQASATLTNRTLFTMTRANRLIFLPADQIIIEQSIDGGTTWTDAGASDTAKQYLFSGRNNGSISFPKKDGKITTDALLRITFSAMKYNVPTGTAETDKYNYWNSTYIQSQERYCTLHTLYFWVNAVADRIWVKLERATGASPNNWINIFDTSTDAGRVGLTGWSGMDFITFDNGTFGGGTNQTSNYWNYRLTFRSCSATTTSDATLFDDANLSTSYATSTQQILGICGYGDNCWGMPYELGKTDHMYSWDLDKNVTFPAKLTAGPIVGTTINGYTLDIGTNNTSDTWVPVMNGNTIQHRVIPTAYNNAPSTLSVNYATSAGSATSAGTASYLSTGSSGEGTGVYLSGRGANYIYAGPNDSANGLGGALNNLVFSSWWGVSFTTSCQGQSYTGTNAVSIDCRSGDMFAKNIYLNGSRGIKAADFSFSNGTLYITTT